MSSIFFIKSGGTDRSVFSFITGDLTILSAVEVNKGDLFNADNHEAVTQIPAPNEELKGKIIDIVEKGYKLGDKIIRFPKVVIGQ